MQFKFHMESSRFTGTHLQPVTIRIEQGEPTPAILNAHPVGIWLDALKHLVRCLKGEPPITLGQMDVDIARLIGGEEKMWIDLRLIKR